MLQTVTSVKANFNFKEGYVNLYLLESLEHSIQEDYQPSALEDVLLVLIQFLVLNVKMVII